MRSTLQLVEIGQKSQNGYPLFHYISLDNGHGTVGSLVYMPFNKSQLDIARALALRHVGIEKLYEDDPEVFPGQVELVLHGYTTPVNNNRLLFTGHDIDCTKFHDYNSARLPAQHFIESLALCVGPRLNTGTLASRLSSVQKRVSSLQALLRQGILPEFIPVESVTWLMSALSLIFLGKKDIIIIPSFEDDSTMYFYGNLGTGSLVSVGNVLPYVRP